MSKIFNVWSTHGEMDPAPAGDTLETSRTSKDAAYQDKDLIQAILHRTAWVQEV